MKHYIEPEYVDRFVEENKGKVTVDRYRKGHTWCVNESVRDPSWGAADHEAAVYRLVEKLVRDVLDETDPKSKDYRKASAMCTDARIRSIMRMIRSRPEMLGPASWG